MESSPAKRGPPHAGFIKRQLGQTAIHRSSPTKPRAQLARDDAGSNTCNSTESLRPRVSMGSRSRHPADGSRSSGRLDLTRLLFWTVVSLSVGSFLAGMVYQGASTHHLDKRLLVHTHHSTDLFDREREEGEDRFARAGLSAGERGLEGDPFSSIVSVRRKLMEQLSEGGGKYERSLPTRLPKVAMVLGDLVRSPENVYALTLGTALNRLGYNIEVISLFGGSMPQSWQSQGIPVNILNASSITLDSIDWLRYDAVLANGMEAAPFVTSLSIDPFGNVPLVWVMHDDCTNIARLQAYASNAGDNVSQHLRQRWRELLNRADALIAPSKAVQEHLDALVGSKEAILVPGNPGWVWQASEYTLSHSQEAVRARMGLVHPQATVVALVGPSGETVQAKGQRAACREMAHTLRAVYEAVRMRGASSWWPFGTPKAEAAEQGVEVLSLVDTPSLSCSKVLKSITLSLAFHNVSVHTLSVNSSCFSGTLEAVQAADIVVLGAPGAPGEDSSKGLPAIMLQALALRRTAVAPETPEISTQIKHRSNGLLFSPSRRGALAAAVKQALGLPAREQQRLADAGRATALRWGAQGAVHGVVQALEALLHLGLPYAHSTPLSELGEAWSGGWVWGTGDHLHELRRAAVATPTEPITETGTLPVRAAGVPAAVGSRGIGASASQMQGLSMPGSLVRALGLRVLLQAAVSSLAPSASLPGTKPGTVQSSGEQALPTTDSPLSSSAAYEDSPPASSLPPASSPTPLSSFLSSLTSASPFSPSPGTPPDRLHAMLASPRSPVDEAVGTQKARLMSGGGCVVEELEQLWRREAVGSTTPVGPTATEGTVGRAGGTGEGGVGSVEATVKRSADAGLSVEELKRIRLGSLGELEQPELALQEGEKGLEGQDVIPLGSPEDMAEADQLADRKAYLGTYDEIRAQVKKLERDQALVHLERDEGDLERTGQPLSIYELYEGNGSWPFLHAWHPLYRGVSMEPRGRRRVLFDDINGWQRLPIVSSAYYRGALGEMSGLLSMAYHLDHIHRQPWIGFHSWRATARGEVLSPQAEARLLSLLGDPDFQADALVFWVPTSSDPSLNTASATAQALPHVALGGRAGARGPFSGGDSGADAGDADGEDEEEDAALAKKANDGERKEGPEGAAAGVNASLAGSGHAGGATGGAPRTTVLEQVKARTLVPLRDFLRQIPVLAHGVAAARDDYFPQAEEAKAGPATDRVTDGDATSGTVAAATSSAAEGQGTVQDTELSKEEAAAAEAAAVSAVRDEYFPAVRQAQAETGPGASRATRAPGGRLSEDEFAAHIEGSESVRARESGAQEAHGDGDIREAGGRERGGEGEEPPLLPEGEEEASVQASLESQGKEQVSSPVITGGENPLGGGALLRGMLRGAGTSAVGGFITAPGRQSAVARRLLSATEEGHLLPAKVPGAGETSTGTGAAQGFPGVVGGSSTDAAPGASLVGQPGTESDAALKQSSPGTAEVPPGTAEVQAGGKDAVQKGEEAPSAGAVLGEAAATAGGSGVTASGSSQSQASAGAVLGAAAAGGSGATAAGSSQKQAAEAAVRAQPRRAEGFLEAGYSTEEDFWTACDDANRGHCRTAFLAAFRHMYGLPANWVSLPPMPSQTGTWATLHSWALPTASFVEFITFARMFVDALDKRFFNEHYIKGICMLASNSVEAQQCYGRALDRLVNVWAYHSGRRFLFLDPRTGVVTEHHRLEGRKGPGKRMWQRWFNANLIKSMAEDRAEEWDDMLARSNRTEGGTPGEVQPVPRWLWPHTGEVSWKGSQEREKKMRMLHKVEREKRKNEKLARMRVNYQQKPLGNKKQKKKRKGKKAAEEDLNS